MIRKKHLHALTHKGSADCNQALGVLATRFNLLRDTRSATTNFGKEEEEKNVRPGNIQEGGGT